MSATVASFPSPSSPISTTAKPPVSLETIKTNPAPSLKTGELMTSLAPIPPSQQGGSIDKKLPLLQVVDGRGTSAPQDPNARKLTAFEKVLGGPLARISELGLDIATMSGKEFLEKAKEEGTGAEVSTIGTEGC